MINTAEVRATLETEFNKIKKEGVGLTDEQMGAVLNSTAWIHRNTGWRLFGKKGGTNVPMPNGTLISADYLVNEPAMRNWDCFLDAGGPNSKVIGPEGEGGDPSEQISSGERTIEHPVNPADYINDGDTDNGEVIPPPAVSNLPSYDQFVHQESWQVARKSEAARNHPPNIAEMYHNAWRRLVEGMSHEDILKDIK